MRKLLFLLLASGFAACNNGPAPANPQTETKPAAAVVPRPFTDSATRPFALNFLNGCVENAKLTLGEAKAFAFCKCMYNQVHAKYPDLDSAALLRIDSAEINRMAASCR